MPDEVTVSMRRIGGAWVDVQKIAEGLLDLFSESDLVMAKFGMLPAGIMETLEHVLDEKAEDMAREQAATLLNCEPAEITKSVVDKEWKRRFMQETQHAVTVELYRLVKPVV